MDRIARADAAERRLAFEAAAIQIGTTPAVVEKDFWVCYTLEHLFHCGLLSGVLAFKGGASLSSESFPRLRASTCASFGPLAVSFEGTHFAHAGHVSQPSSKPMRHLLASVRPSARVSSLSLQAVSGATRSNR